MSIAEPALSHERVQALEALVEHELSVTSEKLSVTSEKLAGVTWLAAKRQLELSERQPRPREAEAAEGRGHVWRAAWG